MTFDTLKARLIAYNERGQEDQYDEAVRLYTEAMGRHRDEAVREVTERIAAAILASAPPPRAHTCEVPEWCLWCAPSGQARKDAAIVRQMGGAQ